MSANSAQAWRRWFGLLFLAISFGMLIWGQTFLQGRLAGTSYLFYWSICFLFTFLTLATALLDILLVRRQIRRDQRALLHQAFTDEQGPQTSDNRRPIEPGDPQT